MTSGRARLADWIRRSGCTQTKAAEILGITTAYLSQLLSGVRTPGLTNAIKIEDITGIAVRSWELNPLSESDVATVGAGKKRQR